MHPLVTAYFRVEDILLAMAHTSPVDPNQVPLIESLSQANEYYDEVVASCFSPKVLVGFFTPHDGRLALIWLWHLNAGFSQYYLVDEQEYSRPFTL